MKILAKYLEEVQQEHKLVCDNKNLVSHQLGLPVQGDGGIVVKLREEGKVGGLLFILWPQSLSTMISLNFILVCAQ